MIYQLSSSRLSDSRVYVAGHRGLAGSAIFKRLEQERCGAIIARTHAELDLVDQGAGLPLLPGRTP